MQFLLAAHTALPGCKAVLYNLRVVAGVHWLRGFAELREAAGVQDFATFCNRLPKFSITKFHINNCRYCIKSLFSETLQKIFLQQYPVRMLH